ncbi:F-box domain-containing protein [Mycena chlorophos]|uniref:F-box domain-containing protein n=1 Tax=Mycena chlorophos TaxID=658473 RepID=A0A8H6VPR4_MYCCL|nr:F-box domain-containing protein [Mycena chlorophos]
MALLANFSIDSSSVSSDSNTEHKTGRKGWTNPDMEPVPVHLRTWTTWNYVAYWFCDAFTPVQWELASTMIAVGLSWKQCLLVILFGQVIMGAAILATGTIGARLHIAFPVIARVSFGFWFSYFAVVCRVFASFFWFGIQTYIGSECTYQMLKALVGPAFLRIPNHLPESAGITTTGMLSFLLFWLIELPFFFVSPTKIRHLFVVKTVVVPITCLGMLIWAAVRVPPHISLSRGSLRGASPTPWAVVSALNSAIGCWSPMAVNMPDFTRYAKNEKAQYIQIVVFPLSITLITICGIVVASTTEFLYGEVIWDPLLVIDRWDSRPASFFAALSFALAVLGTNIAANSVSAANDMTVLWPRYINIRRGQVVCGVVSAWALCPWKILSSAPGFLTMLSSYSIFMAPMSSIMVVDYFIVRKCKVDISSMYEPDGRYKYWNGINWRAVVAFIVGFIPTIPGLVGRLDPSLSIGGTSHIFDFGWLYAYIVAAVAYCLLSAVFPPYSSFVTDESP